MALIFITVVIVCLGLLVLAILAHLFLFLKLLADEVVFKVDLGDFSLFSLSGLLLVGQFLFIVVVV